MCDENVFKPYNNTMDIKYQTNEITKFLLMIKLYDVSLLEKIYFFIKDMKKYFINMYIDFIGGKILDKDINILYSDFILKYINLQNAGFHENVIKNNCYNW